MQPAGASVNRANSADARVQGHAAVSMLRIISIENTCWMPSHRAVTNCIVYSINVSTATCEKVEKGDKVSVYLLQKALYIMKRAAPTSVRRKKERIGVCIGYGKSPPHHYIKGPIHYEKSPIFYSDK